MMLKLLLTITCRNVSTFRDLTQLFAAESIGCFCLLWERYEWNYLRLAPIFSVCEFKLQPQHNFEDAYYRVTEPES